MNKHQQIIESLLFFKNEPVSFDWLAKHIKLDVSEIQAITQEMVPFYEGRGMELALTENSVALVTNRDTEKIMQKLADTEEEKELSKQALETLAIIIFKQAIAKPEIDFIRGVNSLYILRNLTMRGLIEKKPNPNDKRSPLYVPTTDLLAFLGITNFSQLPQYDDFRKKLEEINHQFIKESETPSS